MCQINLSNYVEVGDCHEWQGTFTKSRGSRYPSVEFRQPDGKRKRMSVLRAVWLAAGRKIPKGHIVWRKCANDACINLQHLRCGPRGSQLTHLATLGKMRHAPSTIAKLTLAARRRPTTTCTMAIADQIRALRGEGLTHERIAAEVGQGITVVKQVLRGETWRPIGHSAFSQLIAPRTEKNNRHATNAKR